MVVGSSVGAFFRDFLGDFPLYGPDVGGVEGLKSVDYYMADGCPDGTVCMYVLSA